MVPFFIFYSMFGFQRVGDLIWAAADAQAKGFLIGATAGRTTLLGEGLQHQDGHSLVLASTVPTCRAYDPAFAYEMGAIIEHGLEEMFGGPGGVGQVHDDDHADDEQDRGDDRVDGAVACDGRTAVFFGVRFVRHGRPAMSWVALRMGGRSRDHGRRAAGSWREKRGKLGTEAGPREGARLSAAPTSRGTRPRSSACGGWPRRPGATW